MLGDHAAVVLVLVDVVDHVSLHSLHRDNISVNLASNVESANSILPHSECPFHILDGQYSVGRAADQRSPG